MCLETQEQRLQTQKEIMAQDAETEAATHTDTATHIDTVAQDTETEVVRHRNRGCDTQKQRLRHAQKQRLRYTEAAAARHTY